jgi:hypothetical protein
VDFLTTKVSRLQETVYSLEQSCRRRKAEEQGIQEFDNPKEIMMIKILSAIIINHVQSLVSGTLSSIPDFYSSSNPMLSSLTFSNQTDHQNDRYNMKQACQKKFMRFTKEILLLDR